MNSNHNLRYRAFREIAREAQRESLGDCSSRNGPPRCLQFWHNYSPPLRCPETGLCSPLFLLNYSKASKDPSDSQTHWVLSRTYLLASLTWTSKQRWSTDCKSSLVLFSKEDLSRLKTSALISQGWWILTSISLLSLSPELQSAPAGYRTFLRGCSTVNSN